MKRTPMTIIFYNMTVNKDSQHSKLICLMVLYICIMLNEVE